jgi:hypothetical protein
MVNSFTERLIIMNYPECSGGKLIANCLSFSKNVIPLGTPEQINPFLQDEVNSNRINHIFSSLPNTNDIKSWRSYELKTSGIWGQHRNLDIRFNNYVVSKILEQNKFFFAISHCEQRTKLLKSAWPNAKIISVTNFAIHRCKSYILGKNGDRSESYNTKRGPSWPNIKDLTYINIPEFMLAELKDLFPMSPYSDSGSNFVVDVEKFLENKNYFLETITHISNRIGLTDLDIATSTEYYTQYLKVHGIISS